MSSAPLSTVELMAVFGMAGPSWERWRVALTVLAGLPLADEDRAIFEHHTHRTRPPSGLPREAFFLVGRGGGKSRVAALKAQHAALRPYRHLLARGEQAVVGLAAADRAQARVCLGYTVAPFEDSDQLRALVARRTRWELELKTGASIEVRTAHYGRIRGRTFAGFIADEVAFWPASELSANPAEEVLTAVRPALRLPGAQLIAISTPYARRGPMWEAFARYFGQDDDQVLVWHGTSREMNPTLDERLVLDALERDEATARSEWLAEFRSDLESYIGRDVVEGLVVPGRRELPRVPGARVEFFTDPAGGSGTDEMVVAGAHAEKRDGRVVGVLDVLRHARPPFSPERTVAEFAALIRSYGATEVTGDRYAGEWPREQFRKHGVAYRVADLPKSDLYRELLPLINSDRIELLDHPRCIAQLVGLERRTGRSGRDAIDHAPGAHDDLANAAAGALVAAARRGGRPSAHGLAALFGTGAPWPAHRDTSDYDAVPGATKRKAPVTFGPWSAGSGWLS